MAAARPSILLIDDNPEVLNGLQRELVKLLKGDEVDIRQWLPSSEDSDDPDVTFHKLVDETTALVITDYDLTKKGLKGLFGITIVGWCQKRGIPVGDFSRGNTKDLPKEPNLFELRVPSDNQAGARFIADAFSGFQEIRSGLQAQPDLLAAKRSLAAVLATLLRREHLDSQFSLYMARLGSANSSLVQRLQEHTTASMPAEEKVAVLTYVLGHVLLNSVLKFPGPIVSRAALVAYLATSDEELNALDELFGKAHYAGPFGRSGQHYWKEDVDSILDEKAANLNLELSDVGDYNRRVVELALGRSLAAHKCERNDCHGKRGGFLCPFTKRAVCARADCSIAATGWVPQGAQLSRVERDFYDEWAPLLGL